MKKIFFVTLFFEIAAFNKSIMKVMRRTFAFVLCLASSMGALLLDIPKQTLNSVDRRRLQQPRLETNNSSHEVDIGSQRSVYGERLDHSVG